LILLALPIPVAFGTAILRFRLWDIDRLVRRTAVYSLLIGTLAVVYFSCVVGAQAIVQAVGGRQRLLPVVVVASTLLIATLF
jgi:hypothetical protein